MNLEEQTKQLILECESCITRFFRMREEDLAPRFFEEVKPHADAIAIQLADWQQLANEWIRLNRPKYMHAQQIVSAVDAMNQFVVQSFYKETSKKRLMDSIQSTMYTMQTLYRYIEEVK